MESHSVVMKGERIMVKYHNLMQCVAKKPKQNKLETEWTKWECVGWYKLDFYVYLGAVG